MLPSLVRNEEATAASKEAGDASSVEIHAMQISSFPQPEMHAVETKGPPSAAVSRINTSSHTDDSVRAPTVQHLHDPRDSSGDLQTPQSTASSDLSKDPMCQTPLKDQPQQQASFSRGNGVQQRLSYLFRRSNTHTSANLSSTPYSASSVDGSGDSDTAITHDKSVPSTVGISTVSLAEATNSSSTPFSSSLSDSKSPWDATRGDQSSSGIKARKRTGITFGGSEATRPENLELHRSSSVNWHAGTYLNQGTEYELTRHLWGMPAEYGTGLKARRMSLSLPDDFTVDVVELHKEFSAPSKIFGRRGKTLGKGATSTVTLMTRKGGSSDLYAVKEFRGKFQAEAGMEYETKVKSEYSIAKSLHHPNIIETIRLCTHQGRWNHVMEYCSEGDMFNIVQKGYLTNDTRLADRLCLFKQVVQGVNYLHEHGIAHRDIKLENLLLTKDSKLKITDFGVSEVFSGIHPGLRAAGGACGKEMEEVRLCSPGICGSLPYIAPEVLSKNGDYDPRPLDVWSSAIVMLHFTFGGALWPRAEPGHANYDALLTGWTKWEQTHSEGNSINESDYPHVLAFDQHINPPALRRLLIAMLHPNPNKRCSIAEVAKHRWFKNIDCCQVESYDDATRVIDASQSNAGSKSAHNKVVRHNHLPPVSHKGHSLVRLPGSTDMWN